MALTRATGSSSFTQSSEAISSGISAPATSSAIMVEMKARSTA